MYFKVYLPGLPDGPPPGGEGRQQHLHPADPQHWGVLSPLLYSLFTHDCVATHASNSIIEFADDTTVVGLITNNDETAYREEVRAFGVWCQENNLTLNVNKTKEMIVDFRKQQREHPPIHIDGTVVERVASFKFLGVHITEKLNWSTHTDSIVKKAQQRLFNLRRLKKFGLSPKALTNFYRCTIESILSGCITAWYGNCSAHNRKALQRVVRSAQRITGGKLPALQDTYTTRCHRKAIKIIKDNNHPSHCLFTPLSSRRRGHILYSISSTASLCNTCITSHFNYATLFTYSSHMYILYSIPSTVSCLCCSVPSLIHISLCTYSLSPYTVYKTVVLELLVRLLVG
uniref:Reverse transcriptase domain-containing protein n=1 Tax=Oncorhynchus mykiss TaxID=8022 RepID=A0A8K9XFW9_ONCMY